MITWLTSGIWKALAKWTLVAALLVAGYWRIYASGKSAEAAEEIVRENAERRERENKREKVDAEISTLDADRVRDELRRWVRE